MRENQIVRWRDVGQVVRGVSRVAPVVAVIWLIGFGIDASIGWKIAKAYEVSGFDLQAWRFVIGIFGGIVVTVVVGFLYTIGGLGTESDEDEA